MLRSLIAAVFLAFATPLAAQEVLAPNPDIEATIAGPDAAAFFAVMYGNEPDRWDASVRGFDRIRVGVNYFTRMRFIDADGALELDSKEGAGQAPAGFFPWFDRLHPDFQPLRIVFGHWAALQGRGVPANCLALETGCVWDQCMTLVRLEDGQRFTCGCAQGRVAAAGGGGDGDDAGPSTRPVLDAQPLRPRR